jgi:hypothetical protein
VISFSDFQLLMIQQSAEPLPVEKRSVYLERVATKRQTPTVSNWLSHLSKVNAAKDRFLYRSMDTPSCPFKARCITNIRK